MSVYLWYKKAQMRLTRKRNQIILLPKTMRYAAYMDTIRIIKLCEIQEELLTLRLLS